MQVNPCPNDEVASSISPIVSDVYIIPEFSPGRSMPVFVPKLNMSWYLRKSSVPSFDTICMSESLHEFINAPAVSSSPCDSGYTEHLIIRLLIYSYPSHVNLSLVVIFPVSNAPATVNGLKVDPGSNASDIQ